MEGLKRYVRERVLRLPEGNPPIPHGDPGEVETWNPGEGYLRYRLLGFWIGVIPGMLVALAMIGAGLAVIFAPEQVAELDGDFRKAIEKAPAALRVMVGLAGVSMGLFTAGSTAFQYVVLHLELDMLRYTLTDQALRLRRGVVSMEEVTLSFSNIQNVQYIQGPLQRYFGIGDLIVETAGGGMAAPQPGGAPQAMHHQGLITGVSDPERLRDTIQARVRRFKGSGLGADVQDLEAEDPEESEGADFSSPEARALLAEDLLVRGHAGLAARARAFTMGAS